MTTGEKGLVMMFMIFFLIVMAASSQSCRSRQQVLPITETKEPMRTLEKAR